MDGGLWGCRVRDVAPPAPTPGLEMRPKRLQQWVCNVHGGCPALYLPVPYLADPSSRPPTGLRSHESDARSSVPVLQPPPRHIARIPSTYTVIVQVNCIHFVSFLRRSSGVLRTCLSPPSHMPRHLFAPSRACMDAPSFSHGHALSGAGRSAVLFYPSAIGPVHRFLDPAGPGRAASALSARSRAGILPALGYQGGEGIPQGGAERSTSTNGFSPSTDELSAHRIFKNSS